MAQRSALSEVIQKNGREIVSAWVQKQQTDLALRNNLLPPGELQHHASDFMTALSSALERGGTESTTTEAWSPVRDLLSTISRSRAKQGFTPAETATFVFSLKKVIFDVLRREVKDGDTLAEEIWKASAILDELGLYTTETYQKGREEIINRQQQELMELSTPVVQLWTGVLALPLIGTLDSARTQVVMESLLQSIVDTGSSIAIIDITGVPVVDTLVAQHLLKTVAAARLMGADCIISGIRPQIAQTIVHLGVEISDVMTKATLADAFAVALTRVGLSIVRKA